jgi:hypothetical protein
MNAPPLSVEAVAEALRRLRLPLTSEKALQLAIAEGLADAGFMFVREHRLSSGSIVDLFCDGVGIEVKIGGGKRDVFRQVKRYAAFDEIRALILATNLAMGLPPLGKPVVVVDLGRAWL